jgi:hypothetical protein
MSLTLGSNNAFSIHFLFMSLQFLVSIVTFLRLSKDDSRSFHTKYDPVDCYRSLWTSVKSLILKSQVNPSRFAIHRLVFSKRKFLKNRFEVKVVNDHVFLSSLVDIFFIYLRICTEINIEIQIIQNF